MIKGIAYQKHVINSAVYTNSAPMGWRRLSPGFKEACYYLSRNSCCQFATNINYKQAHTHRPYHETNATHSNSIRTYSINDRPGSNYEYGTTLIRNNNNNLSMNFTWLSQCPLRLQCTHTILWNWWTPHAVGFPFMQLMDFLWNESIIAAIMFWRHRSRI